MSMTNIPGIQFDLGDDIAMLREALQQFVAREIAPRAAEIDRSNHFPMDLWRKLGELGVLGITVEEEFGGTNMGYLAHIVAMEEISPRLGLGRTVLWRAFQPVREPDPAQRQRSAEGALPAEARRGRARRRAGHERAERRLRRRVSMRLRAD